MNKFIGTLILQNLLTIILISFIPLYLVFKKTNDVSNYEYYLLFIFLAIIFVITILDGRLLSDENLSFGFIRFYPFIILLLRFNSILRKNFSSLSLSLDQKCLLLVYFMNKHSVLSDESYFSFSRLISQKTDKEYEEYSIFTESPFWVELYEDLDEYGINRELLASYGIKYNEKNFVLGFIIFIILYLLLILLIVLN